MNLHVGLAGCVRAWRFHDSHVLDCWLAGRPWLGAGGVKVVRVSSRPLAEEVEGTLRRGVRAHDDPPTDVRLYHLSGGASAGGFRVAAADALGLAPGLDRRCALQQAAQIFADRPTVLLVPPLPPGVGAAFHASATAFADEVCKSGGAPATILFIDTPDAPVAGEAYDLTVGGPADGVLKEAERGEAALWRAYVHARLAWEVAGDVARATRWDTTGFAVLPTGDDRRSEALLNECAAHDYSAVAVDDRTLLLKYLGDSLRGDRSKVGPRPARSRLEGLGLLWRPPGESRLRPAPWVARALLSSGEAQDSRNLLRACLVAAPLAKEMLSRCFDLESRGRALCWMRRRRAVLGPGVRDRFDRFLAGWGHEYDCYPPGCPAAPDDEWPFASFGELLDALANAGDRPLPHLVWLRDLRNVLAHGHYVCWHAIIKLRQIEEECEG